MNIEGTYTLQAPCRDVWNYLMDQRALQIAIPGAERVEVADEDCFAIALRVSLTPLAGLYQGRIIITERDYPSFCRLTIEGEGGPHTVKGEGSVRLNQHGDLTVVAYQGTVHLSTLGEQLPASVVRGAAKLLLQQFFSSLAAQLPAADGPLTVAIKPDRGMIVLLPALTQPTLPRRVVRRLGLGAGDPVAESRWADGIKRAGILLGLLLLVWIGSKVPKK